MFTSPSNNNNNPNHLNSNNQTSIFSAPTNSSNNSFGNLPPQPSIFGSTSGSGGPLVNLQSSGGPFVNNQIQQQFQGEGFFISPAQQPGGDLNPFIQGVGFRCINGAPVIPIISTIPANGTADYIGNNSVFEYPRNKDRFIILTMTARITGHTLDEIRMKDYFNFKNNTLPPNLKDASLTVFKLNSSRAAASDVHSSFLGENSLRGTGSGSLFMNPQPSQSFPFGQNTQIDTRIKSSKPPVSTPESVFANPQLSQLTPSPKNNLSLNKSSEIESSHLSTQTPKPTALQPETKSSETTIVRMKPTKPENKTLQLSSGTFGFELNKMLFVSGLVQIMEKHNMKVPENLLDDTDFVPQLLDFLEQNGVSLPTENIPQFQVYSSIDSANEEHECE